jgi:hypothetical protein
MPNWTAKELYVDAARRHGQALARGDSDEANAAYDEKVAVLRQLRSTPDRGCAVLRSLLTHEDPGVRKSAATHLLPLDETAAIAALEEVSRLPGLIGFDAEMVLREWKAGRLKVL